MVREMKIVLVYITESHNFLPPAMVQLLRRTSVSSNQLVHVAIYSHGLIASIHPA